LKTFGQKIERSRSVETQVDEEYKEQILRRSDNQTVAFWARKVTKL